MTTNYICMKKTLNIRQAMRELIVQAGENDNISTLYVVDENNKFSGAIDLKDLIIARENEISARRDEEGFQAYFNCHTDITIPYDELGAITVPS